MVLLTKNRNINFFCHCYGCYRRRLNYHLKWVHEHDHWTCTVLCENPHIWVTYQTQNTRFSLPFRCRVSFPLETCHMYKNRLISYFHSSCTALCISNNQSKFTNIFSSFFFFSCFFIAGKLNRCQRPPYFDVSPPTHSYYR